MKKFLMFLMLTCFSISIINAQSFWRPIPADLLKKEYKAGKLLATGIEPSAWLIRPAVTLTAVQITYNKDLKQFESVPFNSGGIGLSYQKFKLVNDLPYAVFAVNALLLYDGGNITTAVTLTGWQYFSFGVGRNFGISKFVLLTGVVYNFNK
jgi:hypothetical protein